MLFGRRRRAEAPDFGPARLALAQGKYEAAFTLLEDALDRAPQSALGVTWLQLAAVYALYAEEGLENGQPCLRNAVSADPDIAAHPLYRALYWEFAAYRGASVSDVKRGLRGDGPARQMSPMKARPVRKPAPRPASRPTAGASADGKPAVQGTPDPLLTIAEYHAAAALFAVDALKSAKAHLLRVDAGTLPDYLEWRRWSLLGQCEELLGSWEEASQAFRSAALLAPEPERGAERLSLAGCLIEMLRPTEALAELELVQQETLERADLAVHRYLAARAHLDLDNPNRALELLQEAAALDDEEDGGSSYSVTFAQAQAHLALGDSRAAVAAYREALATAPSDQLSFTQHEAAVAMIEADMAPEAEQLLAEVIRDPSYPYLGEALADLADAHLRLNDLGEAARLAERALDLGATAAACLTLGSVAFEYYHLDEATSWFEQAVSATQAGDPLWVAAQQLLADVYAQMGDAYAPRLLQHAQAALRHTDARSEWFLPLKQYVDTARTQLGGHERVLN